MLNPTGTPNDAGAKNIEGCGPLNAASELRAATTKQQIYEAIRAQGEIARVDISKQVGVSAGSVTTITAELIASGLVTEVEATDRDGESGRGRPPVSLRVNPESHFVAGIKLSTPYHSAVIMDMSGDIRAEIILPCTTVRHQAGEICDFIDQLLQQALEGAGLKLDQIDMIGVGLPGFVDHHSGVVAWSPLLATNNIAIRDILQERVGIPVDVDNDANLLTLAELWFGAGRSMRDFAVVTIEHGIGMGLVIDNQLYRGARGMGMELGHTKVQLDGALCRCGQRGCLEAYVADYALVREASTALNMPNKRDISDMMEELFNEAKSGNEAARAIFHRAGRYLAVGLANVINLFDPSLIILSGDRIRYDYLYAKEVLEDMATMTPNAHSRSTKIQSHQWGDLVWAQGAAALALSSVTNTMFES